MRLQADIRRRSEFWIQELRRQEALFVAHPQLSSSRPGTMSSRSRQRTLNSGQRSSRSRRCFIRWMGQKPCQLLFHHLLPNMLQLQDSPKRTRRRKPKEEAVWSTEEGRSFHEDHEWHQRLLWLFEEQRRMWKRGMPQTDGACLWVVSSARRQTRKRTWKGRLRQAGTQATFEGRAGFS